MVIPMLDAMGNGWTYTVVSIMWILFSPGLWALMKYGSRWRQQKKKITLHAKGEVAKIEREQSDGAVKEEVDERHKNQRGKERGED